MDNVNRAEETQQGNGGRASSSLDLDIPPSNSEDGNEGAGGGATGERLLQHGCIAQAGKGAYAAAF